MEFVGGEREKNAFSFWKICQIIRSPIENERKCFIFPHWMMNYLCQCTCSDLEIVELSVPGRARRRRSSNLFRRNPKFWKSYPLLSTRTVSKNGTQSSCFISCGVRNADRHPPACALNGISFSPDMMPIKIHSQSTPVFIRPPMVLY